MICPTAASLVGRGEQVVGGSRAVSRIPPMVREDRGIRCAVSRCSLDKARNSGVALAAGAHRQRRVGDLANQAVLEAELVIALDAGVGLPADQIAQFQRGQQLRERARCAQRFEAPLPEDVADDRGAQDQLPLRSGKAVQTRRNHRLEIRREITWL